MITLLKLIWCAIIALLSMIPGPRQLLARDLQDCVCLVKKTERRIAEMKREQA